MKKQTNTNWQKQMVFAVIATMVFMFAASSLAFAQATYKVGDRIEAMLGGEWVGAEFRKLGDNGWVWIRFDGMSSDALTGLDSIRPIKAGAPTNKQNNAGNQTQNQTNGNTQTTNGGGTAATQQGSSIRERYGSRDPRTCGDQKAPARGAITAAFAKKYFICKAEGISSNLLYLVENVSSVQVGGGVPYHPTLGAFEAINVRIPLYPIRGSYLQYQCKDLLREHSGPPDTNCNTYNNLKATGYCYKTTFGDWSCHMSDRARMNNENMRKGIAPPK